MSTASPEQMLAEAQRRFRQGETEAAAGLYADALAARPGFAPALVGLGLCARRRGDRIAALDRLDAAAAADPANPNIRLELALEQRATGRIAEAEASYDQALALRPGMAPAMLGLALCARLRGARGTALTRLQEAVAADPASPGLHAELATELRHAGREAEADTAFAAALERRPGFLPALVGLAVGARRRGDLATALLRLSEAVAADPGNAQIRADQATALREAGRLGEAEAAASAALALRADCLPALLCLAHCARARGDHDAARDRLRAAAERAPANLPVLLELAAAERDAGDPDAASAAARAVLQHEPASLPGWLALGLAERRAGRRAAARDAFAQARAHHPQSLPALLELAAEAFALGEVETSMGLLEEAAATHPDSAAPLVALARQQRIASALEEAVALGHRADALAPETRPAAIITADALFELERPDEALAELEAARQAATGPARQAALAAAQVTLLRRAGLLPEALALAQAQQARHPAEFGLWRAGTEVALRLGAPDDAAACFAAAPAPTGAAQRHALAICRAEAAELARDFAGAKALLEEAAALDPQAPYPRDMLARLALLRWDAAAVRDNLDAALALQAGEVALGRRQARFRLTLPGQILDEAALAPGLAAGLQAAMAQAEPAACLAAAAALARAHADLTAPAMALLVALRRQGPLRGAPVTDAPPIPAAIGLYWNDRVPPPDVLRIMRSWPAQHPDHAIHRFDDTTAFTWLGRRAGAAVQRAFTRAGSAAQRADLLRLVWLAVQGGLWVDADDRCLAPPGDLVWRPGATLVGVQEDLGSLANNFLAATPGHPVILRALREAVTALLRGDNDIVWLSTGPGLLTRALAATMLEAAPDGPPALPPGMVVLDRRALMPRVAMHAAAGYKTSPRHWQHAGRQPQVAGGEPIDA